MTHGSNSWIAGRIAAGMLVNAIDIEASVLFPRAVVVSTLRTTKRPTRMYVIEQLVEAKGPVQAAVNDPVSMMLAESPAVVPANNPVSFLLFIGMLAVIVVCPSL